MAEHTKGPWIVLASDKPNPMYSGLICVVQQSDRLVAVVTDNGRTAWPAEWEGNAHLIAAAPDLLVALEDLLKAYSEPDRRLCCDGRDCGCMGSTFRQLAEHYAKAAIAKVEGRING